MTRSSNSYDIGPMSLNGGPLKRDENGVSKVSPTRISLPEVHLNIVPGDCWVFKRNEEDWPVVICDEDFVREFIKAANRPWNARQEDGQWSRIFKLRPELGEKQAYPVIILGLRKFAWAQRKHLELLDLDIGNVIYDSTTNPKLKEAWEHAGKFRDGEGVDLAYLKANFHAKRLERGQGKSSAPKKDVVESCKRKGTPVLKMPPQYKPEYIDDKEEHLFLPRDDADPKIKQEITDSMSSMEHDELYHEFTPPPMDAYKRSKLDTAGRFSTRQNTAFASGAESKLTTPMHGLEIKNCAKLEATDTSIGSKLASIYVGKNNDTFSVDRSTLSASPLLSSLLAHHVDYGWYIMSPVLSSLDTKDFEPVGEYLERGEYHPNILDAGTQYIRLEGELDVVERSAEVVRCSKICALAQKLELPVLQQLAFRKFKTLAPYYERAFLLFVEAIFEISKPENRQYLVQYTAENFWDLMLKDTKVLADTMIKHKELAKGVFGRLSGLITISEDSVKAEPGVESNVTTETRKEGNQNESLEGALKKKSSEGEDPEETEEGLVQRVLECFAQEATEPEMTNKAQEESEFLEPY